MGTQKITMTLALAFDDTGLQIKQKIVMPVNLPPGTYQATVEVEPFGVEITAGSHVVGHRLSMEPVITPITADQLYRYPDEVEIAVARERRESLSRSAKTSVTPEPVVAQTPKNVGEACEPTSANPPARKRKKRGVVLESPEQSTAIECSCLVNPRKCKTHAADLPAAPADLAPGMRRVVVGSDVDPNDVHTIDVPESECGPVPKEGTSVPETVTDEEAPPSGMVAKPVPVDHDKMERVFAGKPTAEEEKEFKARLSKYVLTPDGILEKAGMRPMEGFGGVHKQIRLYVNKMYPEVDDLKKLTKDQWSHFLATLDLFFAEGGAGAKALIEHIHRMIGAAA